MTHLLFPFQFSHHVFLFLALLHCVVFNESGDGKHPCLAPDLSEKAVYHKLTFRLWKFIEIWKREKEKMLNIPVRQFNIFSLRDYDGLKNTQFCAMTHAAWWDSFSAATWREEGRGQRGYRPKPALGLARWECPCCSHSPSFTAQITT